MKEENEFSNCPVCHHSLETKVDIQSLLLGETFRCNACDYLFDPLWQASLISGV